MDGAASIHFYNSMLSADPGERRAVSPLSVEAYEAYKRQFPPPKKPARPNLTDIKAIGDFLKEQWGNSVGVTKAMNQYHAAMFGVGGRSEERRGGKEGASTLRSRGSTYE